MAKFDNVSVTKKANVFFDGKCVSHTVLFNSLTFVVFFALVMGGYWTLRDWSARKNLLLVASYVFYGAWNPPFALLLFATTALDFWLGARIAAAPAGSRKLWLVASVTANLSMLGFFKYGNFLLENTQWLLAQAGSGGAPWSPVSAITTSRKPPGSFLRT